MNPLGERRLIDYSPGLNLAHHDGSVAVDSYIYADGIVARKLYDRVIGNDRENENWQAILDLNEWQGDLTLTEPGIVEPENQPIPRALDNHFENNLTVDKRVILNRSVALINSAEVNVILTIRRSGSVDGALPAPTHVLGAFARCRVHAFLPRPVRRHYIVLDQFLFTRCARSASYEKIRHGYARLATSLSRGGGGSARQLST